MAHVSGPVSTLPGSILNVANVCCDQHSDRPAVARIQGETDSFGAEYIDCCQECVDRIRAETEAQRNAGGCCDWCNLDKPKLFNRRDFEEGSCGPIYQVCADCIAKENARVAEEFEEY